MPLVCNGLWLTIYVYKFVSFYEHLENANHQLAVIFCQWNKR